MRDTPFSYTCAGCGRCCFGKRIAVSPYEIARIAEALSLSTTDVLARYTAEGGTVLRQREDGGCALLQGQGCGVHAGRPLVCRLYPLGRVVEKGESERFVQLRGHPQSEGVLAEDGTIGGFLESQGVEPYIAASARYFELFQRLVAVLHARPEGGDTLQIVISGAHTQTPDDDIANDDVANDDVVATFDALEWLDIDATLARRAPGEIPSDLEARVALHLSLFEQELTAFESAPA